MTPYQQGDSIRASVLTTGQLGTWMMLNGSTRMTISQMMKIPHIPTPIIVGNLKRVSNCGMRKTMAELMKNPNHMVRCTTAKYCSAFPYRTGLLQSPQQTLRYSRGHIHPVRYRRVTSLYLRFPAACHPSMRVWVLGADAQSASILPCQLRLSTPLRMVD